VAPGRRIRVEWCLVLGMRDESTTHRDRVLGALADRQHGVVARSQLLAAGLSSPAIGRAVEAGRLRPVFRGVYAVGHVALRREGWWLAALLACGNGATLSHRTAATLWRLRTDPPLPIDVTTSTNHGRKHARITTHRARLHTLDALVIDDLRVTSPAKTIVDLAAILSGRALREAVERAQDLRRFDPDDVRATLARGPQRRGTRRLADLIALLQPDKDNARSHLERLFLALARKAGLPKPSVNHDIAGRARDFAWPDQRLVVETDGYRYHSSRHARRRDNRRDRQLTALGWRPVRFTYEEIAFEPAEVADEVAELLRDQRACYVRAGRANR
jgi:very-short-patch-repair endonuclease/predicted transcriptional regulator of viral defense system